MADGRTIKLVIEYEGTGLAGWQRQADAPTVQGHLEAALARVCDHPVTVIGAGRTDAGVHAKGQTAHFKTPSGRAPEQVLRGGNALLPDQIAIVSAAEAEPDFHARYHAKSKIYDYDLLVSPMPRPLLRNFVWRRPPGLDLEAMADAASRLIGEHDFASFQSTGTIVQNTVRRMMEAGLEELGDGRVRISLRADGFLRHMVRAIVGTLVLVGEGKLDPDGFEKIIQGRNRSRAGPTAPAGGLCLRRVFYD